MMKGHLISGIKKLAVILIASLMILGLVPVGLIAKPDTVRAEGEFLRLLPIAETSVSPRSDQKKLQVPHDTDATQRIGALHHAYLRFHTEALLNDAAQLRTVKLRLTLLKTPSDTAVPIRIFLMSDNNWNANMTYAGRPSQMGETLLTRMAVTPAENPSVLEIDLTDYARRWQEEGRDRISLHLDAPGNVLAAAFADRDYPDPAFRPCLKIVTGDAQDTDTPDLTKAWLSAGGSSAGNGGAKNNAVQGEAYTAGEEHSTYLKFTLNRANIRGAMYRIYLQLTALQADPEAQLTVYQLQNRDWNGEEIEQGILPQGEERLVCRIPATAENLRRIDLTDVMNDSYAKGETEMAFRVSAENGTVSFVKTGAAAPGLAIRVSDYADVVAAEEAAVHALAENVDLDHITENLLREYVAENGERVSLSWKAVESATGLPVQNGLRSDGTVTRPRWFEESHKILATVKITAGNYTRQRSYYLTILPEDAPDDSDAKYGSMVDIGTAQSEEKQRLESVATSSHSRWMGAQNMTYRTLRENSVMVVHFAADPTVQNYITFKLWAADAFYGLQLRSLQNTEAEPVTLTQPEMVAGEDGFLYLTCALPMSFTEGLDRIHLRLTPLEQEGTEGELCNLYGAYVTQSPYFDPALFTEQGEVLVRKDPAENSAFYRFLKQLYAAASLPFQGTGGDTEDAAFVPNQTGTKPQQALLVQNGEEKIAVSIGAVGETVQIHRETPYYHAYTETVQKSYYDGAMTAVDYGVYRVFQNHGDTPYPLPWKAEGLSGLYEDLVQGGYVSFLKENELLDDSVLPAGTAVEDGGNRILNPGENTVFLAVAKPLFLADWRVSSLGRQPISAIKTGRTLTIDTVGIRNMGAAHDTAQPLVILCETFAQGKLTDAASAAVQIAPGETECRVSLPHTVTVQPGQTVRVYIESDPMPLSKMEPKLTLP